VSREHDTGRRQSIEMRRAQASVVEQRQAIAAPLIGGDEQNVQGAVSVMSGFVRLRECAAFKGAIKGEWDLNSA
jgi:hypothetical protein